MSAKTPEQMNQDLMRPMEGVSPRYLMVLACFVTVIIVGVAAFSWQVYHGLGVSGLRRPVFWGFYITNFVFWIGLSHAGTLISAILRIANATWRRPVTRCAEVITVFALMIGATFVARSFSGDKKQLVPLIMAGLSHNGPAFIDVISPCVAFNNHPGSTKSFEFVRAHNEAVNRLDFMDPREPIHVDYEPGTTTDVTLHDGSKLRLAKLHADYDPTDRIGALTYLQQRDSAGELVTGLIYMDPSPHDMHGALNTVDVPLNTLNAKELCPGSSALEKINSTLR